MALFYAAFLVVGIILCFLRCRHASAVRPSKCTISTMANLPQDSKSSTEEAKKKAEIDSYKSLYYKVQNLEQFPEIVPFARQTLLSLLRQAVLVARLQESKLNILNFGDYSAEKLATFMAAMRNETYVNWKGYTQRRDAGGGPEMFANRDAACNWVKENAPLQLVDGAWVARVHNVTTPFALRGITKNAWQTYCEELGDGELDKNHCYIYRELCRSIGYEFPDQHDVDFIHPKYGLDKDRIWRAGAGHLLISLFPNEFLPEILGFNLHYESLAPGTLKAARELPEFGISGYYFAVHICIDNADSGHSAMAEATINTYIEHVRKTGIMSVEEAWKRVQAGFLLSEYLDGDEDLSKYRDAVAEMIHNKAGVAGQVHCTSRARIGGRKLTDWFSKDSLSSVTSKSWKEDFVSALAQSKPWIYPGDSERGLLLKELSWKGRMFGAFTHNEVQCLRTWIDLLDDDNTAKAEAQYWKLVGRPAGDDQVQSDSVQTDAAVMHPAFPPQLERPVSLGKHEFIPMPPLSIHQVKLETILPLWFTHSCILEQAVMSPYRTTRPLGSIILQLLRAESGYMPDSSGIAGMDEQRNPGYNPSLTELGLEMTRRNGLPEPTNLKDILRRDDFASSAAVDFSYVLLSWAARPIENGPFLLGLARAFLDLEIFVSDDEGLLSRLSCEALKKTIAMKHDCFDKSLEHLAPHPTEIEDFITGYEYGRKEIEKLLVLA